MARPGPPPKPKPLRLLEGNPGHKPIPASEPAASPGSVEPPAHLTAESRAVWEGLAAELESKGLLAPRYLLDFEVLCDAVVQYRRAAAVLARTGPVIRGRSDEMVTNPASREFARYAGVILAYGREFGLTPASVTAIARGAAERDDSASPARLLG